MELSRGRPVLPGRMSLKTVSLFCEENSLIRRLNSLLLGCPCFTASGEKGQSSSCEWCMRCLIWRPYSGGWLGLSAWLRKLTSLSASHWSLLAAATIALVRSRICVTFVPIRQILRRVSPRCHNLISYALPRERRRTAVAPSLLARTGRANHGACAAS